MNIYNAIMKAADHIEKNPQDFNFMATRIPHACGSPGCALGWIGHFAGMSKEVDYVGYADVSRNLLQVPPFPNLPDEAPASQYGFYERMNNLCGTFGRKTDWRYEANSCAKALRLYAAKYHAPDKPERTDFIPAEIRALFNVSQLVQP